MQVKNYKNVEHIKLEDKEIFLIGTAHVSKESIKIVEEIINKEKPDVIGVELCPSRYGALINRKKWENTKITEIIRRGQTQLFLLNLFLSIFQRKIGESLKVKPGAEMVKAIKCGEKISSKIVFLDRDIQITLRRVWREMRFLEKCKIIFSLILGLFQQEKVDEKTIEKLKEKDVLTQMIDEIGREIPSVKKVLIDERDAYIANKILDVKCKKMVCVVGAGHVEGIKKGLKNRKDIKSLEEIPKKSKLSKYVGYLIPAIFIGIIGYGFVHHKSVELTLNMFGYWFLINGTLSAIGAILALAHPLTIVVAFLAAPFTSLNPTIGAGVVAGLVEAKMREPTIKDFQNLNKITTIKGFYENRVSRILLVAAFVNIGSSIGTFVALPYLLSFL